MEPRIHRVLALMTADLSREIPLADLALSVNLSVSRMRHLFKRETGTSPTRYLKARRMQKAKLLLDTTFLNVKEIMHQVGFKDRSHFVRGFKKAYGLPPIQYRNQFLTARQAENPREIAELATEQSFSP